MKQAFLFIILFSATLINAQGNLPEEYDTTVLRNELILSGNGEFGATAMQNAILNKLVFGGVELGNNVILAGNVGIANQVKIGDGAIASAKAGIHNDVPPGEIVSGMPAISHKIFLKTAAIYNRLPEIYQSLKQIQRRLKD